MVHRVRAIQRTRRNHRLSHQSVIFFVIIGIEDELNLVDVFFRCIDFRVLLLYADRRR
jgi:hypothetical protein